MRIASLIKRLESDGRSDGGRSGRFITPYKEKQMADTTSKVLIERLAEKFPNTFFVYERRRKPAAPVAPAAPVRVSLASLKMAALERRQQLQPVERE
jgi:hypothetical protein